MYPRMEPLAEGVVDRRRFGIGIIHILDEVLGGGGSTYRS